MYKKLNHKKLPGFRNLLAHAFYPVVVGGSMYLSWYFLKNNYSIFYAMVIPLLISNAIVWATEFYLPFNLDWHPSKKILGIDIAHALITALFVTPILKMLLLAGLVKFDLASSGLGLWPHSIPLIFQLILAILIADLLIYVLHRVMHATDLGWKIHVVHHTTEKMHFWAASRTHPLNSMLVYTIEVGVLLLIGINAEALTVWTVFMSINGVLSHCNIDLRLGILNRIFATADVHRVHHSTRWDYSNSNFGNTTCIWDQVFGTYKLPSEPVRIQGIKMHNIPENFLDHMKVPFILDKYKISDR